jgi:hypothetical protein
MYIAFKKSVNLINDAQSTRKNRGFQPMLHYTFMFTTNKQSIFYYCFLQEDRDIMCAAIVSFLSVC